jgi:hypothetical protein
MTTPSQKNHRFIGQILSCNNFWPFHESSKSKQGLLSEILLYCMYSQQSSARGIEHRWDKLQI